MLGIFALDEKHKKKIKTSSLLSIRKYSYTFEFKSLSFKCQVSLQNVLHLFQNKMQWYLDFVFNE